MLWAEFCGGAYTTRSKSIAADMAVNIYTETREVPGSPKQVTLYGTPGQVLDVTLGTTGNRGWFTQDGQTWTVYGDTLYERIDATTYTSRGTINNDGLPVTFASNGQGGEQLAIVGGGFLYVLNLVTNALTIPALPFVGPVMVDFLDGYGLINQADSPIVWFSALEDFTSWDPLDFYARSGTSDNIVGIKVSRDRVWTLGSKTTNQYYNSGDVDTPFLPYPGTTVQVGLVSPTALALYDDVLFWIAKSPRGEARIVQASDPTANTISTPPIDRFLAGCSTLETATVFIYQQEGHTFLCVTCPGSPDDIQTYSFDMREGMWHARAGWNSETGRYTRWNVAYGTVIDGDVIVGDYLSGNVYTLSLDAYTDNGAVLRRERRTPYLGAENQWLFVDQFELGMQPGVGLTTGQGSAPAVNLEISRDGANTWVSAGASTLGAIGDYAARAIWRRLGRVRSDRLVMRVTQTDPVKCVWGPGAWLRLSPGTGQL